jgi:hypothetical protein
MGEVVQFVPRAERERIRLIREARAIYDSIFPPAEPAADPGATTSARHAAGWAHGNDGVLPS